MRIEVQKLFFIFSILIFLLMIWDFSIALYWKVLSVFLHESFHAVVGFILGGSNISIILHSSESGTTKIQNLSNLALPIVVSAGYLGNILMGGYLLSKAFQYNHNRTIAFFSANWIIITAIFFLDIRHTFFYYIIFIGIIYNLGALFGELISSFLTLCLGVTLLMYGVYDIYDIFTNPEITDAGIFARWIIQKALIETDLRSLALNIGLTWYILSGVIIFFFAKFLILGDKTGEKRIDRMISLVHEGSVPKDVANWFLEKGKDIDGIPLSGENLKYLKRGSHE